MIQFCYGPTVLVISLIWIAVRVFFAVRQKQISWKRELQLLLVYICIVVVVRFTFFPFFKIDGKIQPLIFDAALMCPPRVNLIPFVNLLNYDVFKEMLINVVGNTAMFIPLGVVWPSVFKQLNTHGKVFAAGIATSLIIEILQLPFFDRVSDVDDLILNTVGFLAGYGLYLLVKAVRNRSRGV